MLSCNHCTHIGLNTDRQTDRQLQDNSALSIPLNKVRKENDFTFLVDYFERSMKCIRLKLLTEMTCKILSHVLTSLLRKIKQILSQILLTHWGLNKNGILQGNVAEIYVNGYRICSFWKMFHAYPFMLDCTEHSMTICYFSEMSRLPDVTDHGNDKLSLTFPWQCKPWYTSNQWAIKFTTLMHLHCDVKIFYHSAHFSHTNVSNLKHVFGYIFVSI